MAKCAECGSETELHELGVAVCPACIAKRETFRTGLASLFADLTSARDSYREAIAQLADHLAAHPESSGHPDRAKVIRLKEDAKAAEEKYREVLRLYSEIINRNGGSITT